MIETHQHTTLIYKGQPENWVAIYQPEGIEWEVVGLPSPELRSEGATMGGLLDAYTTFTDVPMAVLAQVKEECELIPITVTYTY